MKGLDLGNLFTTRVLRLMLIRVSDVLIQSLQGDSGTQSSQSQLGCCWSIYAPSPRASPSRILFLEHEF